MKLQLKRVRYRKQLGLGHYLHISRYLLPNQRERITSEPGFEVVSVEPYAIDLPDETKVVHLSSGQVRVHLPNRQRLTLAEAVQAAKQSAITKAYPSL